MPESETDVTHPVPHPRPAMALVLASLLATAPAGAQTGPCDAAAQVAAAETGVPLPVLRAITRAETGRMVGGQRQPWPWTVNHAGTGQWFETRAAAKTYAETALSGGTGNLDIGCFQLNHRWHSAAFASLDQMFDPVENARHAARFLAQLHRESGDWTLAAGAYHSRTPEHAERYRTRFTALLAELDPMDAAPIQRPNRFPLLQPGGRGENGSLVPVHAPAHPLLRAPGAPLIGG